MVVALFQRGYRRTASNSVSIVIVKHRHEQDTECRLSYNQSRLSVLPMYRSSSTNDILSCTNNPCCYISNTKKNLLSTIANTVLAGIVLYSSIYIAPLNSHTQTEALVVNKL